MKVPYYDLPPDELASYSSQATPRADLLPFWRTTLAESRARSIAPSFTPVSCGLELVDVYDVQFSGFNGDVIRGWLQVPVGTREPLPTVVEYPGYGGGRSLPHRIRFWAVCGYACFVVDMRGQGASWIAGDTPDDVGAGPSSPGFVTRGILSPETYYYRRAFTDAVLAIDAVGQHPRVDASKIVVTGASQGGGVSLAVAGLRDDLFAVMADVPFLCDFPRATAITDSQPYGEIVSYLKVRRQDTERVFDTLSYFDCALLVRSATAPALFSVALMDRVCPPSTVYAAYNAYPAEKSMKVYPFNDHEGGQTFQEAVQISWLGARVNAAR